MLTQDHMGLEISKCYSYSFHPMSIKLHEDIGYHWGIQAVTFLGNRRSSKKIVALWNLINGNQWENHKMCNTLKTADRRANRMKIWDSRNSICKLLFGSGDSGHLSSVWGHSVHLANVSMLRFSKGYWSHIYHRRSFMESIVIREEYRLLLFLTIRQRFKNFMALWIFFNTGPYGLGISKCY